MICLVLSYVCVCTCVLGPRGGVITPEFFLALCQKRISELCILMNKKDCYTLIELTFRGYKILYLEIILK